MPSNGQAFLKAGYKVWEPSRPAFRRSGLLLLNPNVEERINKPSCGDHDQLRAQSRATFDAYVEDGTDSHTLFKRICKKRKLYEIRILAPNPGARLVGGFINADTFVGVHFYLRDELPFQKTGQKGLITWAEAKEDAVNRWNAIVPNVPRVDIKQN